MGFSGMGWAAPDDFLQPGDSWRVPTLGIGGVVPHAVPFSPLSDQVLVKCLPDDDRMAQSSRIIIPQTADRGKLKIRTGVVVALGCGDAVAEKCAVCDGTGHGHGHASGLTCYHCKGTGYLSHSRTPFTVRVGDRVLYHPRDWAEHRFNGEDYIVLHEDQHIVAILDPETVVFAEDVTTKSKGEFAGATRKVRM